ncbi:MAG: GNAT family N-acetyltransferase [Defluviitaleaceae bacterium]|nr:GNAT family N-acetyltransferase [Defluviitaleaceae bacterium]
MDEKLKQQALQYLASDNLHHIGMTYAINRGTAEIIYAGTDGVMLRETESLAIMQSVPSPDAGHRLFGLIPTNPPPHLFLLHQGYMLEHFKTKFNMHKTNEDVPTIYRQQHLPTNPKMHIQPLNETHLGIIMQNYNLPVGEDYIKNRLAANALFGAYVDSELVGFAGEHAEGNLGMLVVLPKYRRQGHAASITAHGINRRLNQGLPPFSYVHVTNYPSLEMHKKLGFTISEKSVWWLFS